MKRVIPFRSRRLGPTELTWDEKNPSDYRFKLGKKDKMKTSIKEFFYVDCGQDILPINVYDPIKNGAIPILWNNKGLFCIISRQKVQNVIDLIKDVKNLPELNKKEVGAFRWEDGELITAKAAAMLLS